MIAESTGAVISPEMMAERSPAVLYDFRRPTTLSREHSRTLELAFETFARQWGTQLTARVRVLAQVTCDRVEMHTYDDYVDRLPPTTVMMLCAVDGIQPRGVFQFPASGALNWVSHILGAQMTTKVNERKFTRIEYTLVQNLVSETLEDLHYSLGRLLTDPVSIDGIHYNAQFAQAAAKTELMICSFFTVRVGEAEVKASLALPAEVILPQLGEGSTPEPSDLDAELLREHLTDVPMDLALGTSPTEVTPEQILQLSEGDVLTLNHMVDKPLHLTADGQQIATAAAGSKSGRISAVVANTSESA